MSPGSRGPDQMDTEVLETYVARQMCGISNGFVFGWGLFGQIT